jgi:hypothetical protein
MDDSNAIVGNNLYGVQTITTNTIDASYNWWGDINGPTTRNGDAISGNISYLPIETSISAMLPLTLI